MFNTGKLHTRDQNPRATFNSASEAGDMNSRAAYTFGSNQIAQQTRNTLHKQHNGGLTEDQRNSKKSEKELARYIISEQIGKIASFEFTADIQNLTIGHIQELKTFIAELDGKIASLSEQCKHAQEDVEQAQEQVTVAEKQVDTAKDARLDADFEHADAQFAALDTKDAHASVAGMAAKTEFGEFRFVDASGTIVDRFGEKVDMTDPDNLIDPRSLSSYEEFKAAEIAAVRADDISIEAQQQLISAEEILEFAEETLDTSKETLAITQEKLGNIQQILDETIAERDIAQTSLTEAQDYSNWLNSKDIQTKLENGELTEQDILNKMPETLRQKYELQNPSVEITEKAGLPARQTSASKNIEGLESYNQGQKDISSRQAFNEQSDPATKTANATPAPEEQKPRIADIEPSSPQAPGMG